MTHETRTYRVTGMTCGHCVASVTEEISEIVGVTDVAVDLPTGAVTVTGVVANDAQRTRAVDALRVRSGGPVDLLGICQGGVFALCYAALRQQKLGKLITMVTPVDFQTADNMLSHWARQVDVDLLVDTLGNIPADLMNASYLMLKPFRLNVQKYVGLLDILDDKAALEDFLRMEKWIFDSPDLAGEAFRDFIKQFYQANGLMKGTVRIGEEAVDLSQVTLPVLNIYAEQDHLVPPDASRAMRGRLGTDDYTESSFRGGHIGIYVSGRAQREVPATIDGWLKARDL